ncbi:MAG: putative nucleic acid-binding protein [Methanophagales archaeon]|nr:putative nucleic acid-binding protein [Methanophagales archaeon]
MEESRREWGGRRGKMHKCLRCGREFERLTEDLMHGCPACGGKLFLYVREQGAEVVAAEEKREEMIESEQHHGDVGDAHVNSCVPASAAEEEQIAGLRILSPGVYELNLASLLQQKEIILGLKREGTYAIPLTSLFGKKKKERHP